MKKSNVTEPRIVERSHEPPLTQSQCSDVAPLLTAAVGAVSKVTTSSDADIRELAFQLHELRGRRDGRDVEDWLEAEAMIRSQPKQAA